MTAFLFSFPVFIVIVLWVSSIIYHLSVPSSGIGVIYWGIDIGVRNSEFQNLIQTFSELNSEVVWLSFKLS